MVDQAVKVIEVEVPGPQGPDWLGGDVTDYDPTVSYAHPSGVRTAAGTYRSRRDVPAVADGGQAPAVNDAGLATDSDFWSVLVRTQIGAGASLSQQLINKFLS